MNCKIAAQQISRSFEESLPIKQHRMLEEHKKFCPPCDTFHAQLMQMQEMLKNNPSSATLSQKAKDKIQARLEETLGE